MDPSQAALFTDLYEVTMMQGYWAAGRAQERASFELFFRSIPEEGGYCLAFGIEDALRLAVDTRFTASQVEYLGSLGLFKDDFLDRLRTLRFEGEVRALAEGTLVFPNEPIVEVCGPLLEAQWLETMLLNCINFQTLIGTKASRIVESAAPATVVEFGMRRAQGPNGALWSSKNAYLGGCVGTSNLEAGHLYGIPVYGTHAHSWIMSFPTEEESFRAYADTFPDHSIFLIDTYDTLNQGLPKAIIESKRLAAAGHRAVAIRLDSGDLAYLSKACRAELDRAGLPYVKILASGDIDEYVIQQLKLQGAPIDIYGIGTRLATAFQEPALNGVYKLAALESDGVWQPKMKISSNPAKTTFPGRKQIWRWESAGQYQGDVLAHRDEPAPDRMRHPEIVHKQTAVPPAELTPLLEERVRHGELVRRADTLQQIRQRVSDELAKLPPEHHRLSNPHIYRVGLSSPLWTQRAQMIQQLSNPL